MGSSAACWVIKLMICFVFLCTFVRISSTSPVYADDDEDQASVDNTFLNNYAVASGRFHIPENLNNYHHHQQHKFYQNKQDNPDNVQLSKRIIMLPRVGRRSIRSTLNE
ncbi:unnamed protein product [Adineta steineri]|uniref:Uncharacterized protein n=1 Tax=Adineta steineri TaxID=433720 RepID=A0A814FQ21_9BILA|nr:unnamed protein product [Adineta steineri]CAF0968492.1 unnamed protein product [Adineta steineri]CAF0984291.1 unnamed protein product [Adineta steineri]CAF1010490.1 unnamed protein product [Adineta steineri]CAF1024434.1 unnamed protein product [Adineta steineri]